MSQDSQETTRQEEREQAEAKTEMSELASSLLKEVLERFQYYVRDCELPHSKALEVGFYRARSENMKEWIVSRNPADVEWNDLFDLMEVDEEAGLKKWEQIKSAAAEHVLAGNHVADAGFKGSPWQRALFGAVRAELIRDWEPRNGLERACIDQICVAYMQFLNWQKILDTWTETDYTDPDMKRKARPVRLTAAEAIERSAAMVDRFNRITLRTMRALRDFRRYSGPIFVQNAGQVNVGEQQVNVQKQGPMSPVFEEALDRVYEEDKEPGEEESPKAIAAPATLSDCTTYRKGKGRAR